MRVQMMLTEELEKNIKPVIYNDITGYYGEASPEMALYQEMEIKRMEKMKKQKENEGNANGWSTVLSERSRNRTGGHQRI